MTSVTAPPRASSPAHLLLATGLAFFCSISQVSAQVSFTGLGSDTRMATSVSADGSTVVGMGTGGGAFRWTTSTGAVELGTFPGGTSSYASGVSSDGSIVVGFASFSTHYEPFRWTQAAGMVSLGKPANGEWSQVYGVSGDGSIAVGTSALPEYRYHATRWTGAAAPELLPLLAGGIHGEARGISADGLTTVGHSYQTNGTQRAVSWTPSAEIHDLGTLNRGDSSAIGASADGTFIVGTVNGAQAFLWSEENGMVGLGSGASVARAVSNDGSLVIGAGDGGGFIWSLDSGVRNFQQVLEFDYGLAAALESWKWLTPFGMSTDGRFIVGYGSDAGRQEGWLLDRGLNPPPIGEPPPMPPIPEASTYGVVGAGLLVALVLWRKRRPGFARQVAAQPAQV